jgi:molecular chaperone GrpE
MKISFPKFLVGIDLMNKIRRFSKMSAEENVATEEKETMENTTQTESTGEENQADSEKENSVVALLKEELEKAKQKIASLEDSFLRERAEFQNYKRRTAAEYAKIKGEAVKNFIIKILNPIDNLERVGTGVNVTEETKPFIDGVGMILRDINGILEKENVTKVSPVGQPFDPTTMEAIASDESEEVKEETVTEVYQPGYVFTENNESFALRPARVKVARPKF